MMAATTTTPAFLTLQDRVAIVTGSSCGIGKAIAINLASMGAKLVINYTSNKEQAELVAKEINSGCVDASIADSNYHTIANTSVEDFDRIFRGRKLGKTRRWGRIIWLSSSLEGLLKPNIATYTASKAAVETMTKVLAKELKGTAITANCVAPGPTARDMFLTGTSEELIKRVIEECPHGRLGKTTDVAPLVGFLASDASEWINGRLLV
ncbi:hypothetical protein Peur_062336 [Populus x canadensis]